MKTIHQWQSKNRRVSISTASVSQNSREENSNGKCGKREKFEWEEGKDGRKLANWLAVVIQFKMDRRGDARIDTQMSRAYEHELADGTRLVSIRIILLSIGPRHPDATEGTRECTEKHTGVVETRGKEAREKKRLATLHRESALIKAPFYTFRWHQGITSVTRYFFHPFSFAFLLSRLFSPFSTSVRPFFFGFVFATSDTWDMKLREGKRRKETRMSFTTTLFALNCFERSVLGFRRILRQISSRWNFEKFNHRVRDRKMTTGSEALRKFAVSWRLLEEWNLQKFKYCIIL